MSVRRKVKSSTGISPFLIWTMHSEMKSEGEVLNEASHWCCTLFCGKLPQPRVSQRKQMGVLSGSRLAARDCWKAFGGPITFLIFSCSSHIETIRVLSCSLPGASSIMGQGTGWSGLILKVTTPVQSRNSSKLRSSLVSGSLAIRQQSPPTTSYMPSPSRFSISGMSSAIRI